MPDEPALATFDEAQEANNVDPCDRASWPVTGEDEHHK